MEASTSRPCSGSAIGTPIQVVSKVRKWCSERKRDHSGSLGRGFRTAFRRRFSFRLRKNHAKDSEQAYVQSKLSTVARSQLSSTPSKSTHGDLCRGCQAIMPNDATLSNSVPESSISHHEFLIPTPHFEERTISSIKDTASSGCQLCRHMEAALQKHSRHSLACKYLAENTAVESFNYLVVGGLKSLVVGFRYFQKENVSEHIKLTFPVSANPGK